jgi:hypothetical protein
MKKVIRSAAFFDRLDVARRISTGKRVVDIGGSRMNPTDTSPFDMAYRQIQAGAREYTIVDRDSSADIVCDLSDPNTLRGLVLPACDVVLCMETLEHLRNPGMVCDLIAAKVREGATAYVTLPRSSLFYRHLEAHGMVLWWEKCHHLYAFHRHHLNVFIGDNFAGLTCKVHACLGKYDWKWPLVWAATFGRGLSWGVLVSNAQAQRRSEAATVTGD